MYPKWVLSYYHKTDKHDDQKAESEHISFKLTKIH